MRRLFLMAAVCGIALLLPRSAEAQCGAACQRLIKGGLPIGHGCVVATGNNQECLASVSGCQLSPCFNTMMTDSGGALLASITGCDGKRTPRPLSDLARKKSVIKPGETAPTLAAVDRPSVESIEGG